MVEVPVLLLLDLSGVQVSSPHSLPKIDAKRLLLFLILFCCSVPHSNKDDDGEGVPEEEQGTATEVDKGLYGDLWLQMHFHKSPKRHYFWHGEGSIPRIHLLQVNGGNWPFGSRQSLLYFWRFQLTVLG